jgi:hypothetical protein
VKKEDSMARGSLADRVEAELRAQGLHRSIEDPIIVRRIVSLLGVDDANAREKRLAEVRRELARIEVRIRLGEESYDTSPLDRG